MQQPSPSYSPNQIKEKLLQALDRDYNVINMPLALEVVSLLERSAITKEALETTRLGRLVNEMRKKTTNDNLAKRAKDLVRRWRDMVTKPAENGVGGTGQGPGSQGTPLGNYSLLLNAKDSALSPALCEFGKRASPALPKPIQGLITTPSSPAFRGVNLSPALQRKSSHPMGLQQRVISPSNSVASNASTSPGLSFSFSHTHSNSSRPSTPSSLVVKSKAISPGPGRPLLDSTELPSRPNHHQSAFKRTREHDEETMTGFELPGKRSRGSNGVDWALNDECSRDSNLSWSGDSTRLSNHGILAVGEDRSISSSSKASRLHNPRVKGEKSFKEQNPDVLKEKFASIARMPKVKTTQEIVEGLARRSESPSLVAKSEFQPFQTQAQSVKASSETRQWPDAKHEIMAKFLQSHSPEHPERDSSVPFADSSKIATAVDPVAEIYARLPPLDPASIAHLWPDEVQEVEEEAELAPTQRKQVTQEVIDHLHTGEIDGVNGTRDAHNEFHEWHETITVTSYQGDPLHLLPYVVIE